MTTKTTTTPLKPRRKRKIIQAIAGYSVAIGCLYWMFRRLPLDQLLHALQRVQWQYVTVAALVSVGAYLLVAWQWRMMLLSVGPISFWRSTQAVLIARFANDTMPVHAGYLVRAFLAARGMNASLVEMAPSLIAERLLDGLWLAVGTGALSFILPLPRALADARNILAAAVVAGVAATAILIRWRPGRAQKNRAFARMFHFVDIILDGIRNLARSRHLPAVVVLALVKLLAQAAAVTILLYACRIHLSAVQDLAVFAAGYLAMCVPSTPAGGGLFQVLVGGFLGSLGVARPEAAGFSLLAFFLLTLPPGAAGFIALSLTGMSLRQIQADANDKM